ncbi:unnamed protein product, partial [Tilletia controversa]
MPAHRKKKSVPDAAHASLFTLPRRPGYDSITKQYWCGCAVNGCSSSGQALSPVSKRTWHSHKRDQEFFELRQAIERADPIPSRGILQESRIQSASSSSGHQHPSDHGGAYTFGEEGGNAFHSGPSDYNEDSMHLDFDPGDNGSNNDSQGGPSLDIDGINAADRETDAEDESDGGSEEDMDEFGDGVEPERVLDPQRPALPDVEPEEPPIPSSTNSNLPTS